MWWLSAVAWAANPWIGLESNVVAQATIEAPREVVYDHLLSLERFAEIMGEDCTKRWSWGVTRSGEGAMARVTYVPSMMHRRLTVEVSRAESPRIIDYDHDGDRGFVTRWTLAEVDGGTEVSAVTYVTAPGWPFRKLYYTRVMPAWTSCYVDALQRLPERVP